MDTNEKSIRLSGTANIRKELELEKNYDLTISNAEVRKVEQIGNNDGTYDKIFHLRISVMSEVNIIGDKELIKAKPKGTQSQMLRAIIRLLWEQQYQGDYEDFENFYKEELTKLIDSYKEKLI